MYLPPKTNQVSQTTMYIYLVFPADCPLSIIVLLVYVLFGQFTNNTYFLHVNIKAAVDRATKMY